MYQVSLLSSFHHTALTLVWRRGSEYGNVNIGRAALRSLCANWEWREANFRERGIRRLGWLGKAGKEKSDLVSFYYSPPPASLLRRMNLHGGEAGEVQGTDIIHLGWEELMFSGRHIKDASTLP